MEPIEAIFLGLVQGLTEFLPVSSSGHLAILQVLLGWEDPEANLVFNIALHVGSLIAVLAFVRREIVSMVTTRPRLILVVVAATLPLVFAIPTKDLVMGVSTSLVAVGALLLVNALVLVVASRLAEGAQTAPALPLPRAILVGLAQLLAILPGISRSGVTLAAGLGVGLEREQAVRFSFLLAVPAIGAAAFLPLLEGGLGSRIAWGAVLAGGLVSLVVSYGAMALLVAAVVRRRLGWFALYCAGAGGLALALGLIP